MSSFSGSCRVLQLATRLLSSQPPGSLRLLRGPSPCTLLCCNISRKTYVFPEVREEDLEEDLVRGSGPGGQSVAKTNNCVVLKHIPTGLIVKCHETRSQIENKKKARERLAYELDKFINKENSFDAISKRETQKKEKNKDRKNEKLRELKRQFKEREGLLKKKDFNGLILKTKEQKFESAEEYDAKLAVAMPKWEADGVRGFWAKICIKQAHLTPVFAKYGLDFHHAQSGYVMMAKWLSKKEPSMIPEYANHYLGVAGFVVNSQQQLLVIQEKYHAVRRWKLPGGHADKGEEISDVAKREVREETGIEAEFEGIVTFRHQTGYRYGCSDFYFICLMHPVNEDQAIKKCEQEIFECKWMDIDEYLGDPNITDANRYFAQCYKDGVLRDKLILSESKILSYNKKTHHSCFNISHVKTP